MMDLLRAKGHEVLNLQSIPKFAKIFILLIKLDNLSFDTQNNPIREWTDAISDLVTLPRYTQDFEHQKTYIRFFIKAM